MAQLIIRESGRPRRRRRGPAPVVLLVCLALLAVPRALAQSEVLPGILGADDRIARDSVAWPWAAIGRLNRATGGFCTATLVGPRHLLTAAHCLFDRRRRRIAPDDIHFVAGYRRGDYLAHSIARDLILPEGYRPKANPDPKILANDWAIVVLRDPIAIRPVPVRALAAAGGPAAEETLLRAGYGQDRAHLLSVHEGCGIIGGAGGGLLLHDCDATHGDSGSPLLRRTRTGFALVGIDVGVVRSEGADHGLAVPAARFGAALAAALASDSPAAKRRGADLGRPALRSSEGGSAAH